MPERKGEKCTAGLAGFMGLDFVGGAVPAPPFLLFVVTDGLSVSGSSRFARTNLSCLSGAPKNLARFPRSFLGAQNFTRFARKILPRQGRPSGSLRSPGKKFFGLASLAEKFFHMGRFHCFFSLRSVGGGPRHPQLGTPLIFYYPNSSCRILKRLPVLFDCGGWRLWFKSRCRHPVFRSLLSSLPFTRCRNRSASRSRPRIESNSRHRS